VSMLLIPSHEQCLNNLRIAFNVESNAAVRYMAFASQADREGYLDAGSLLRAIARSEQIHATNHADVLFRMGGAVWSAIDNFELNSSVENLKTAIAGEVFEITYMYPAFLREADMAMLPDARRSFRYAFVIEMDHVQFLEAMLDQIQRATEKCGKNAAVSSRYYVCIGCGFTIADAPSEHCPVCSHPRSGFDRVH
jgi:rubrerythrin